MHIVSENPAPQFVWRCHWTAGIQTMLPLTPEEMREMTDLLVDLDVSMTEKQMLVELVDSICKAFILQAQNLDPVQLSTAIPLRDILSPHFNRIGANSAFQGADACDNLQPALKNDLIDRSPDDVATGAINPKNQPSPRTRRKREPKP
jgi:hypothetical protein